MNRSCSVMSLATCSSRASFAVLSVELVPDVVPLSLAVLGPEYVSVSVWVPSSAMVLDSVPSFPIVFPKVVVSVSLPLPVSVFP